MEVGLAVDVICHTSDLTAFCFFFFWDSGLYDEFTYLVFWAAWFVSPCEQGFWVVSTNSLSCSDGAWIILHSSDQIEENQTLGRASCHMPLHK
jgi:hypothetical protein